MRILTWNVHGDTNVNRCKELEEILAGWEKKNDAVGILILQEVAKTGGNIRKFLEDSQYVVFEKSEGSYKERNGIIAVNLQELTDWEEIKNRCDYADKREPIIYKLTLGKLAAEIVVCNYHAPVSQEAMIRDQCLVNMFEEVGTHAHVIVAGDFNIEADEKGKFIANTFSECQKKLNSLTRDYCICSHKLDHILLKGITMDSPCVSDSSYSDHAPLSCKFF